MSTQERILAISKELGLSHIGSNLSCLPVLEEIYKKKKPEDLVILDNAHSHLAHLVVRIEHDLQLLTGSTEDTSRHVTELIQRFGIHCDRKAGCDASGGSLGHGLGIAIGYALADPERDVYVILSEGSCMEGSTWEALRNLADMDLDNVKIYTNFNGYSAVGVIDRPSLKEHLKVFYPEINVRFTENGKEFAGLEGHYKKL